MTTLLVCRDHGITGWLARFRADCSGNVAMLFASMIVILLLSIGGAVDIGRWLHARDQTVAAMDAAVLAGGRALQTNGEDFTGAVAAAQKFYEQNITTRLPVTGDTVTFTVVDSGTAMSSGGNAYIETPFLRFAGIEKLPLLNTATTEFSKSELAVGGNAGTSFEISMMLDVTGSMSGGKLEDLKDAASDLINIVVWDDQSEFTSKVALVPFSQDIRLPSSAVNAARGTGLADCKRLKNGSSSSCSVSISGSRKYYLSSCVVERSGAEKYSDAAPGPGQYVMAHYTSNSTGNDPNKKGVCKVPAAAELAPLSNDKDALLAKIGNLSATGRTAGHLGTAWAWYTLSPNWASLWSSDSQPVAYGTENVRKIAILMTDGEYNTQYDQNGVDTRDDEAGSAANGSATTQARGLCTSMKAQGITVYTVGFQLGGAQSAAYQTLQQCATDPDKFYNAEDGEQLKQSFRDIALKLSALYLSN